MTLTYYLITRAILIPLPLIYMFYLARKGDWERVSGENKNFMLLLPVFCLIPGIADLLLAGICPLLVIGAIFSVFAMCGNFVDEKLTNYSRRRNLAIRAEEARQHPTSGQLGVSEGSGSLTVFARGDLVFATKE